jgi:hypothetical protein
MRLKIKGYLVVVIIFLANPVPGIGQSAVNLSDYQSRYPENNAIYLDYLKEITIDMEGDSIKIHSEQLERVLHLNSNSRYLARDKVFSSFFVKTKSIDAQTIVPQGSEFTIMKVEDFLEKDESSSGVFYDDSKSTNFIFPGIKPGSITQLKYQQQILDPRFLNSFFFQSFIPIEKAQLVLKVDKNISIAYKMFHQGNLEIDFSESKKGKYTIYKWTSKNVKAVKYEEDSPNLSYFAPHLVYYISKVKKGTEEHVILGEVKNLFDWYSTFTAHLDSEESPDLRKTVEGLTKNLATEEEKVRAIFYWVQDNIKYIAFEEGMRGFIPHNANYIFSNRYGDCKDMACITRSMLKIAGINSYFTWIGSRDIPYSYEEVPTPIVDNHMIATYYKDGDPQFLDATSKYTQYGLPSSMIQGKQALVQTGPDSYRLETVPVIDRKVNFKRDSSIIKISNGRVIGNGILSEGGYEKIFDTYRITFASGTKLDELIKAKLTRGSNKFLLENYNLTNLTNKDLPLEITYSFNIQDYYKQIGDEIYLNLNLSKPFFNQLIDIERRKYPIETEYKYEHTYITTLEIPNGYEIEHLPRNSEFMNEVAGYSINYELLGSKVILRKTVFVEYLILALEKFPAWNDVINKINEAYTDALILKKK